MSVTGKMHQLEPFLVGVGDTGTLAPVTGGILGLPPYAWGIPLTSLDEQTKLIPVHPLDAIRIRQELGWSERQIAKHLNLPCSTIHGYLLNNTKTSVPHNPLLSPNNIYCMGWSIRVIAGHLQANRSTIHYCLSKNNITRASNNLTPLSPNNIYCEDSILTYLGSGRARRPSSGVTTPARPFW